MEPNVLLLEDFTETERSKGSGSSRAVPRRSPPPMSSLNFTHGRLLSGTLRTAEGPIGQRCYIWC